MREVLSEEYGVQMDAWLDARETELARLVREYAGMGAEIHEEMQKNAVRIEYSRS